MPGMGPLYQIASHTGFPASVLINFFLHWSIGTSGWRGTTRSSKTFLLRSTLWFTNYLAYIICGEVFILIRGKTNLKKPIHSRGFPYGVVWWCSPMLRYFEWSGWSDQNKHNHNLQMDFQLWPGHQHKGWTTGCPCHPSLGHKIKYWSPPSHWRF